MKIAVAGSHGTGKTSFAKGLAKKLGGIYIYDTVREEVVPQKLFPINEKTPPQGQVWLVGRQWQLERLTPEPWVADKNLFDYWVYINDSFADYIKETIWLFLKEDAHYDFVFYLPIEFPMEMDGLRSEDLEFQRRVDERYKKLLDDLSIKYITLPSFIKESATKEEAIEKRINLALKYIKSA